MYKKIGIATIIIVCALGFLYPEKPLKDFLADHFSNEIGARLIGSLIVRVALMIPVIWLMKRFGFLNFSGLNPWASPKNAYAIAIPLTIILLGISINWSNYFEVSAWVVFVFFLKTLSVGFYEEFVFRGLAFPLMIQGFKESKNAIVMSAILSSLIFGLAHYINLFEEPDNFVGITNQVFFATAIGVFFCGIMVRTENIIVPVVLHMLVNFGFGSSELLTVAEETAQVSEEVGVNWNSVIPTAIFFTFILLSGVYMIRKEDRGSIIEKLEASIESDTDLEGTM